MYRSYRRLAIIFGSLMLGCLMLAPTVWAHGNEEHVMGTVKSISAATITVETTDKKPVEVAVTDKTKFVKSGQPATLHDLTVGDRVVIHAGRSDNKLMAHTVAFGSNTAGSSHAAKK